MNILIIYNAPSSERQDDLDTLVQVKEVKQGLEANEHRVHELALKDSLNDLASYLGLHSIDFVFNLVESFKGSDQFIYLIPAYLEALKIPFSGNGSRALALAADKKIAKSLMKSFAINHPDDFKEDDKTYIVKACAEDASIGIDEKSIVQGTSLVLKKIEEKKNEYGFDFFAEEFIEGRELQVGLIGAENNSQVLGISEIVFNYPEGKPHIVDYNCKWTEGSFEYENSTREFLGEEYQFVIDLARKSWDAFGLKGYARVDFRLNTDNEAYVLEVNPNPCITSDSGFIAAAERLGISYNQLIDKIVKIGML
jgi:D-alanine-D-alanine ligase